MAILQVEKSLILLTANTCKISLTLLLTGNDANITMAQLDGITTNIKDVTITTNVTGDGVYIKGESTIPFSGRFKIYRLWEDVYFPKVVDYLDSLIS